MSPGAEACVTWLCVGLVTPHTVVTTERDPACWLVPGCQETGSFRKGPSLLQEERKPSYWDGREGSGKIHADMNNITECCHIPSSLCVQHSVRNYLHWNSKDNAEEIYHSHLGDMNKTSVWITKLTLFNPSFRAFPVRWRSLDGGVSSASKHELCFLICIWGLNDQRYFSTTGTFTRDGALFEKPCAFWLQELRSEFNSEVNDLLCETS